MDHMEVVEVGNYGHQVVTFFVCTIKLIVAFIKLTDYSLQKISSNLRENKWESEILAGIKQKYTLWQRFL